MLFSFCFNTRRPCSSHFVIISFKLFFGRVFRFSQFLFPAKSFPFLLGSKTRLFLYGQTFFNQVVCFPISHISEVSGLGRKRKRERERRCSEKKREVDKDISVTVFTVFEHNTME